MFRPLLFYFLIVVFGSGFEANPSQKNSLFNENNNNVVNIMCEKTLKNKISVILLLFDFQCFVLNLFDQYFFFISHVLVIVGIV